MNKIENCDSIIFDLDGTLWSTIYSAVKSINELREKYPQIKKEITEEEVKGSMGYTLDEIAQRYFPYLDKEIGVKILKEAICNNIKQLKAKGGTLYPEVEKTLERLSKKYKLYIVSNCEDGYIESFFEGNGLKRFFSDYECIGKTGLPKGENIKLVIRRNNLTSPIYVGDTIEDLNAAKIADIPFVYARYGFGDIPDYSYSVNQFSELITILEK